MNFGAIERGWARQAHALHVKALLLRAKKWLARLLAAGVVSLFGGCAMYTAKVGLPRYEGEPFIPIPVGKRLMHQAIVRWEVRDDAETYCRKLVSSKFGEIPLGCALWDVAKNTCTIVTPNPTTHVVLGHELRHCFEGGFHP